MKKLLTAFVILNVGVITSFWYQRTPQLVELTLADGLIALGRLAGLYAVFAILMQFLLMGRSNWLERAFGLDKLAKIHKRSGYFSLTFILAHPFLITLGYALSSKISYPEQAMLFQQDPLLLAAQVAVLLFIVVVISSIYIVRNKIKYEWWYAVHLLTYLAVLLAWFHQLPYGSDFVGNQPFVVYWYGLYFFVFGQVFWFRFLLPVYLFLKHRFVVNKVVSETADVVSIYITAKNMRSFPIQAGQFVKVRFLTGRLWLESHPFSLSKIVTGDGFRLSIKQLGDFTSKVQTLQPGTPVFVEGPYGTFTAGLSQGDRVLCIAGGIGITPIRALLEEFGQLGKKVTVLYANKLMTDVVFKAEIERLAKQFGHQVHYIFSQMPAYKGEKGRLDREKIGRLVPDFKQRDVYICGPVSMMKAVSAELQALGIHKQQIHMEEFSL